MQSLKEYVGGQEQDGDLDFQSIGLNDTRYAGLTIAFQFNRKNSFALSYGNDSSSDFLPGIEASGKSPRGLRLG